MDRGKLSPLLKLKYHNAISDAWADLGRPEEVGYIFAGFQKYLYQPAMGPPMRLGSSLQNRNIICHVGRSVAKT